MKNNYNELRLLINEWVQHGDYCDRHSQLNIGVISGGVDLSEDFAELNRLHERITALVRRAIKNNCRLGVLKRTVEDCNRSTQEMVEDAISEREFAKYEKTHRD